MEALLAALPAAKARSINSSKGLYEIFGVTRAEISKLSEAKPLFRNVYKENLIPRPANFETAAVDLSKCKKSPQSPFAIIEPVKNKSKLEMGIIEKQDGEVSFTSTKSKSQNPLMPNVDRIWIVSAPPGSAFDGVRSEQVDFGFIPDLPGPYSLFLIVQDGTSLCGAARVEFGVTYNEAYAGKKIPRAFDDTKDPQIFHHLDEVKAREAWAKGAKGKGVKIAILDTGVDYNHPDLAANIFENTGEVASNGLDDDGNGFVDDVHGYDLFMNDPFPVDDNMHGTHVAGLAASAVTGVAPEATIIPIKVMAATGGGDLASILGGIYYAADLKADFANMSLGMDSFGMSPAERLEVEGYFRQALQYAAAQGTMVVAASGNGDPMTGAGFDIDKYPTYPASLIEKNSVAVASVDSGGALTSYSNFGSKSVVLAGPGGTEEKPVVAAYYQHQMAPYIGLQGTSMATPVVVGTLAVLKSFKAGISNENAVKLLSLSSRKSAPLTGKVKSGGVVDLVAAMTAASPQPSILNLWGLME